MDPVTGGTWVGRPEQVLPTLNTLILVVEFMERTQAKNQWEVTNPCPRFLQGPEEIGEFRNTGQASANLSKGNDHLIP